MIRTIQFVSVFLVMFFTASGAYGGFLIELKGGAEIIVNDYWEVEGEIRYSRYGGLVGIPAGEVKDIRPTDRPVDQRDRSSRTHGLVPSAPEISEDVSISSEAGEEQPPAPGGESETPPESESGVSPGSEEFRQRSDQLRHELSMNYRDAEREINNVEDARRVKDGDAEQAAMARLRILVEEQGKLTSEIEQLYEGSLPPWWFEIMEGR